jgi:hypothetical protein
VLGGLFFDVKCLYHAAEGDPIYPVKILIKQVRTIYFGLLISLQQIAMQKKQIGMIAFGGRIEHMNC